MTSEWPTGLIEIGDGVFAYVQAGGGLCVANAGLIVGPESCVVIDALFAPSMTGAFRDEIRRITNKPVRLLINTHHHIDHTGGNAMFPEATLLSHSNARGEQERTGARVLDWLRPLIPDLVGEMADFRPRLPDATFDTDLSLHLGDRELRLVHFGRAHTIGDVLVHLPGERLLFTGDIVFDQVTPLAFEGHIGDWLAACDRVEEMPASTIVPGHGPVGSKEGLREMRGYLRTIRDQAGDAFEAGLPTEEAVAEMELGKYAAWAEPERLAINVGRLYQEFRGEI
jgi:glyoxylase-like metal-dependent hydrolase (beta-lactamase superfamily II)